MPWGEPDRLAEPGDPPWSPWYHRGVPVRTAEDVVHVGNHESPSPPRQHQHPTHQQQQRERHAHSLHTQQRAHAPAQPAPDTQAACTASRWGRSGTRGTDGSGGRSSSSGGGGVGGGGGGSPVPHGVPALRPGAEERRNPSALGGPMEEPTGNTVVIRIGIPDLQQT
ncbi:unnamed protein product, partial [Gadus morhua 'NCC']